MAALCPDAGDLLLCHHAFARGARRVHAGAVVGLRLRHPLLQAESAYGYTYNYNAFGGEGPPTGRVWGEVKLWGRVIEHSLG